MATSPSKATVTAIRADTAEVADQIRRTILGDAGKAIADEHDREERRGQTGGHQCRDRRGQRRRCAQHREHACRGQQRHRGRC